MRMTSADDENITDTDDNRAATDVFTGEKVEYKLSDISTRGIALNLEPAEFKILKL